MLNWSMSFMVMALISAILGFGGIVGDAAWIAKVFMVVFGVLAMVSLLAGRPWKV